jgi:hypothetical protein
VDKFFLGLLLGGVLGVGGYVGWQSQQVVEDCGGACGEGTTCIEQRCEVAVAEVVEQEDDKKGKKKRKRGRKKKGGSGGEGSTELVRVNDSHVPRFNPKKAKVIEEGTGSERLSDRTIDRTLKKLDPKFQDCIKKAVMASDEDVKSGRVVYEFGIGPSGKVTGVNVRAPAHLKALGVDSCTRVAVYGLRFPSFDGLEMGAEGSFSI